MTGAGTAIRVQPGAALRGTVSVPGDKSLSHRALILGALAEGASHVRGWLPAGDTLATLRCVQALGIAVERADATTLTVRGRGLGGLQAPAAPLNCVNAGTAIRLLAGVLAGQPFASTLDGSEQLRRRPMRRITEPLRQMGAQIADTEGHAPLHIRPATLRGMVHRLPIASAQVKSGILLAGLFADGPTTVSEPGPARDHTERMLRAMSAQLVVDGFRVTLTPGAPLRPLDLTVPGDPSSAAFLAAAALLVPGSEVVLRGVCLNPRRLGMYELLRRQGARISWSQTGLAGGEPVGDLTVCSSEVRPFRVDAPQVPSMIDELPLVALLASQANGRSEISGAAELRTKESDRLACVARGLRLLGVLVEERPDGLVIDGSARLAAPALPLASAGDHRMAMTWAVAGLIAEGNLLLDGAGSVAVSYPGFFADLRALGARVEGFEGGGGGSDERG